MRFKKCLQLCRTGSSGGTAAASRLGLQDSRDGDVGLRELLAFSMSGIAAAPIEILCMQLERRTLLPKCAGRSKVSVQTGQPCASSCTRRSLDDGRVNIDISVETSRMKSCHGRLSDGTVGLLL